MGARDASRAPLYCVPRCRVHNTPRARDCHVSSPALLSDPGDVASRCCVVRGRWVNVAVTVVEFCEWWWGASDDVAAWVPSSCCAWLHVCVMTWQTWQGGGDLVAVCRWGQVGGAKWEWRGCNLLPSLISRNKIKTKIKTHLWGSFRAPAVSSTFLQLILSLFHCPVL